MHACSHTHTHTHWHPPTHTDTHPHWHTHTNNFHILKYPYKVTPPQKKPETSFTFSSSHFGPDEQHCHCYVPFWQACLPCALVFPIVSSASSPGHASVDRAPSPRQSAWRLKWDYKIRSTKFAGSMQGSDICLIIKVPTFSRPFPILGGFCFFVFPFPNLY